MGTAAGVPAFRWYDRELGRVLVANRPEDASVIEARASTGHGLLADDGVSISNLFTGDAPKASMTMSRLEVPAGLAAYAGRLRPLPGAARRPVPEPLADDRRGRAGAVPGACGRSGSRCTRGCTARGPSPGSARSATGCSAT